ncbi:PQQ-dependent sugar dehydrogenase [Truepera radiovictrix]|uniref:Glucose sorbosone dehydrogenase n=1 Tax=Truepera radiovictrix (strain DSM 17093 / CIP 108686 / LMG 22925 / RQ-24) TaxID=649638 RepID=D7CUP8_TRURR|nr:PQQ-dependent sugar dehydrogenase [Truepera radiovictrix]ADI14039.1 glucose sorbosone dehydrogenase [Truepera radiovictrix DSM 17093]WMT57400.1 PQQ-dependent sugar dehydrogenase [Truepera radiovictrix]
MQPSIRPRRAVLTVPAALAALFGAAHAQDIEQHLTEAGPIAIESLAEFSHPWGIAFLPDGRMLVTERDEAILHIVTMDGEKTHVEGVPPVFTGGQGGLLDVALDPNFEESGYVYLSYAEQGGEGASTALGRGVLEGNELRDFEVIFRQEPKTEGDMHFGSRIVFAPDGTLYLTLADRFLFDPAQDLSNHLGTIVRINPDGSVPEDNPFVGQEDALDEIFSYGHRNIQAAALHPETDVLWVAEMGPLGGDELNVIAAGENYGWPEVSWGIHYDGRDIPDPDTRPEFTPPVTYWTPAIAPSGMIFYTGDAFPAWQGSAFIGGLVSEGLVRVELDGESVVHEERIPLGARVRDVEQGPDGFLYVITDEEDGDLLRLMPMEEDE